MTSSGSWRTKKRKNEKKLLKLEQTLEEAKQADTYRLYGELLTAHLYAAKRGMTEIEVANYYDENGGTVTIPLDPQKSPAENAQQYFQKYQKAKNSLAVVQEQIERTKEDIAYCDTILSQLETAAPKDIEEIRDELIEQGYLRPRAAKGAKSGKPPSLSSTATSQATARKYSSAKTTNKTIISRPDSPIRTMFGCM
ncbi:hypothetical protein LR69_02645 [Geobacillus sp. BCO2]|nr:hypothetical protein LR69_02645 [Geobacillus sp. BCO2]